ncbi:MAG: hypothetical protein U5J99_06430 [Parvularculaceae bacterium]|nr:hypothetical protein [Parvularculaceae bacterium]
MARVDAFGLAYNPYNDIGTATAGASMDAAIACAAHGVLENVYSTFAANLRCGARRPNLPHFGDTAATQDGCALGEAWQLP